MMEQMIMDQLFPKCGKYVRVYRNVAASVLLLLFQYQQSQAQTPTITSLGAGVLPGGISADGSVIVGRTGQNVFRLENGNFQILGSSGSGNGGIGGDGLGVSGDGRVVYSGNNIWRDGVLDPIGNGPFAFTAWTFGASFDGSIMVGSGYRPSGPGFSAGVEAYTLQSGQFNMIGSPANAPGGFKSWGFDISNNGQVITGWGPPSIGATTLPYRYENGIFTSINQVPTSNMATSIGSGGTVVSGDGGTIFGTANFSGLGGEPSDARPFLWNNSGVTILGDLSNGARARAFYGVSLGGEMAVGSANGPSGTDAFLWNSTEGMNSLYDVLSASGLDLAAQGWSRLTTAYDISDDGRFVIGVGIRNGVSEAFVVDQGFTTIPEPSTYAGIVGTLVIGAIQYRRFRSIRKEMAYS
jgi:hypothetical protein